MSSKGTIDLVHLYPREMSIYGANEAEWLLPPGGKLVVDSIDEDSVRNAGVPKATAWKKVRMRQVLA